LQIKKAIYLNKIKKQHNNLYLFLDKTIYHAAKMLSSCSLFIGDFRDQDKHILHIPVHSVIIAGFKINKYDNKRKT